MSTDVLTLPFLGSSVPYKSLLAHISPQLFNDQEVIEKMNRLAEEASDETDCSQVVAAYTDGITSTDGRTSNERLDLRLDKKRMRYEKNRLDTFRTWPETNPLRPGLLARAGFYFTGFQDICQCFSCGGQVQAWEYGDTAMGEHRKHFPNCDFVQGRDNENVALLEHHKQPNRAQELGKRIEKSQKEIEQRAKEKEAMLMQEQVGTSRESSSLSSAATAAAATNSRSSAAEPEDEECMSSESIFRDYKKEFERLQSFEPWPRTSPIEPRDLAKAGFSFTNDTEIKDTVQCFACFGQIGKWKPGDIPAVEHATLFPNCPFVQGMDVENEPISGAPVFPLGIPAPSRALSGPPGLPLGMPAPSRALSAPQPSREQVMVGQRLQRQGSAQFRAHLGPLNNCRHPMYAMEDARLKTFHNWPSYVRIQATPRLLARAGFFFTGSQDECKCFYCDGGLKNWEPNDDPWTEHAKWFPRCDWLIQQRGESFIIHVQRVNPPPVGGSLQFTAPPVGHDETYFEPPHTFHASYQERGPLAPAVASHVREGPREGSKGGLKGGQGQKEMTIEEEKAAALREFDLKNKEPEAAAEFNFKSSRASEGKRTPAESKLKQENAKPSLDDLMQNPTTQMAAEMGYDTRLIRYVIAERLRTTGSEFSSGEELLDAIWQAEKMDIDLLTLDRYSEGSAGRSERQARNQLSSSSIEFQAQKLAGLSLNDDPADERTKVAKTTATNHLSSAQTLRSGGSESLDDKQLCKICLDKELNTVFLPCKHLATCEDCASMVTECPMCRQTIMTSFRVYMP